MTIVGSDETGYQTGLSSSSNLLDWRSEGLILKRNPDDPVTRYNAALTWIVRENGIFSQGRLKLIRGRYLGVYLHFFVGPHRRALPDFDLLRNRSPDHLGDHLPDAFLFPL